MNNAQSAQPQSNANMNYVSFFKKEHAQGQSLTAQSKKKKRVPEGHAECNGCCGYGRKFYSGSTAKVRLSVQCAPCCGTGSIEL